MNKFETMNSRDAEFVSLTENELMGIDGGVAIGVVAAAVSIGWAAYQFGQAAGRTIYYVQHPIR